MESYRYPPQDNSGDDEYKPPADIVAAVNDPALRRSLLGEAARILEAVYIKAGVPPQDREVMLLDLQGHAAGRLAKRSPLQLGTAVHTAQIVSGQEPERISPTPAVRPTVIFMNTH